MDELAKKIMITSFASDILIAYIEDEHFRSQVNDVIENAKKVKGYYRGASFGLVDIMLSNALSDVAGRWLDLWNGGDNDPSTGD